MKTPAFPSFEEENIQWQAGSLVIGIDEVGRGAFAGPIVAAAVVFPQGFSLPESLLEINDSKQVKPLMRNRLSKEIRKHALYWCVSEVDVATINRVGIGKANKMVFRKVISEVIESSRLKNNQNKFHLLVDGLHVKFIREIGLKNQKAIVKGDQKSLSIAAASIIAKVHRDSIMKKYNKKYPLYAFAKNKGYGTKNHQKALRNFGLTKLHRVAFCSSTLAS